MPFEDILTLPPPPADTRLAYGTDPNQFGELRTPKSGGPFGSVMFIHGGFWRAKYDLKHAGHLCAALTAKGIATWNVEYRRVGNAGGGWPGTFEDIAKAYRYLPQIASRYNLDSKKIVVAGHSAGGELEQIQFLLGHVSIQTTERYLGVQQDLTDAPCDHLGIRVRSIGR